jgi:hypothetical protein
MGLHHADPIMAERRGFLEFPKHRGQGTLCPRDIVAMVHGAWTEKGSCTDLPNL